MVGTPFILAILVGVLAAVPYAVYCRRTRRPERLFAVGLAIAALVYVGFALLRGSDSRALLLEGLGLLVFGTVAFVGARWIPQLLAAGWIAHVVWDLAFHSIETSGHAPWWYPLACIGFDLLVGGFIFATFLGKPWLVRTAD